MTSPVSSAPKSIKMPPVSTSATGAAPIAVTPVTELELSDSCNCVCCPYFSKKAQSPGALSPRTLRSWTWKRGSPSPASASAAPPRKSVAAHAVDRSKDSPPGFEPSAGVATGPTRKLTALEFLRASHADADRFDPPEPPASSNVLAASALPAKPPRVSKTGFPDI